MDTTIPSDRDLLDYRRGVRQEYWKLPLILLNFAAVVFLISIVMILPEVLLGWSSDYSSVFGLLVLTAMMFPWLVWQVRNQGAQPEAEEGALSETESAQQEHLRSESEPARRPRQRDRS